MITAGVVIWLYRRHPADYPLRLDWKAILVLSADQTGCVPVPEPMVVDAPDATS